MPPEPATNAGVLNGKRVGSPNIYIGCPRWGVKEWVGKLYPKGTKDARFLDEYVKQFTCVELNSTFYNLYDEAIIGKWKDRAGQNHFKFLPKIFQGISHDGQLNDKLPLLHAFEKSVASFEEHLGPVFLQLSDGFGPTRKGELKSFVHACSSATTLFVEVRHQGWFQQSEPEGLVQLLESKGAGLIITDTAGRRDVCHMHLAIPKAMIRFVANNLHPTDYTRIDAWVERISYWLENGLEELYFIIHMDQEKHSPELAGYLIEKLNERCRLNLKKPIMVQPELF